MRQGDDPQFVGAAANGNGGVSSDAAWFCAMVNDYGPGLSCKVFAGLGEPHGTAPS